MTISDSAGPWPAGVWFAPMLLDMEPIGLVEYDSHAAWSRVDESLTLFILDSLAYKFMSSALANLDFISGEAHVRVAKDGSGSPRLGASQEFGKVGAIEEAHVPEVPCVFISYSWDTGDHRKWVLDLASRLRQDGVKIILDKWHLRPGADKTTFMENSIAKSDFVILVCTPKYAERANERKGGVGYEAMIITGELAAKTATEKFIPVLRDGEDWDSSLPRWAKTKVGVDLRGDPYSNDHYRDLLRTLHGATHKPPPLGPKPDFDAS
jgi:TIR domain